MPKFNVLIVGNAGTGKTNFIIQLINNKFEKQYIPTDDNYCSRYRYNSIDIDLFDTCGQNKYSNFPETKPDVVLIFGASNNMKTADNMMVGWYKKVKSHFKCDIPRIYVMNEFVKYYGMVNIYGIFFSKNITHCFINVKTREGIKDLLDKMYDILLSNEVEKIPENTNNTLINDVNLKINEYFNKYQDEIKSLRKELSRKDSEIEAFKLQLTEFNKI